MSSILIPKEQQSAYERWELASFSDERPAHGLSAGPGKHDKGAQGIPTQGIGTQNAAAKDKLGGFLEQARSEGFEQGRQEGYAAGMAAAATQLASEQQTLQRLANSFSSALTQANDQVAEHLLKLALDIAKAMLKSQLEVDSSSVLAVVRDAMLSLPHVQKPAVLLLNPDDAQLIREQLQDELKTGGWHIREDADIERGGCLVETGANQIDASNTMRWKRISEALGHPDQWRKR